MKKLTTRQEQKRDGREGQTPLNRTEEENEAPVRSALSRRTFLGGLSGLAAATVTAGVSGVSPLPGVIGSQAEAAEIGPVGRKKRRKRAYRLRQKAAEFQRNLLLPAHPTNGDEELYLNKIGSYSKGLPHNRLGEVDLRAYETLLFALSTGQPAAFEAIPMGGSVKLTSP